MNGEIKMSRIRAKNKAHMKLLEEVLDPQVLHARVPRLEETAEARVAHKNRMNTIQKLGALGSTGFSPDRSLQYVANIDVSIWHAILQVFARYDEETGEYLDDGLLYVTDPVDGRVKLNRDFFYALLSGPLKDHDMRGQKVLMT